VEDDHARRVTCPYCGTTSDVSAHVAPPPAPAPAARTDEDGPVVHRRSPHGLAIGLALVAPFAIGGVVLCAGDLSGGVGQRPWESLFWASPSALLVDVDGDPALEVVGHVRFLSGEVWTAGVAAFDPVDEERLWYTEIEGLATNRLTLAVAGDRLWAADDAGSLRMLRLADGQVDVTTSLGETLDAFCATADGGLAARLADRTERRIDLATGALAAPTAVAPRAPCPGGFPGSEDGQTPDTRMLGPHGDGGPTEDSERWAAAGLSARAALALADGRHFVAAARSSGTAVPTVVALASDGAERWRKAVPSVDALKADPGPPAAMAYRDGLLYVGWSLRDGESPHRLACLDARTGERRWDATLPDEHAAESVVADEGVVYVQAFTQLYALDAADGSHRFTIGR